MATVEHCIYCFEVLSATLEKRTPMTLSQVKASWTEYPKGLELDDDENDNTEEDGAAAAAGGGAEAKPITRSSTARLAAIDRPSGTSTPASTSTSSTSNSTSTTLSANTTLTTPDTFHPIGVGRRTQQRPTITESPLFVTWNTISARDGHRSLRGCIGTFESMELSDGLASYALTSALHDVRFNPISKSELPTLEVSVTLLTDFETAKDAMDWELGVHGLRISFYHHHRKYGACYLPDVAPEQGWDKEETIVSLMRKSGWGGRRDKWREVSDMKVVRFQGMAESLAWDEFKQWKEWVKSTKA